MSNGYTDATFLDVVNIPTYGIPGMWFDPDGNGAHESRGSDTVLKINLNKLLNQLR